MESRGRTKAEALLSPGEAAMSSLEGGSADDRSSPRRAGRKSSFSLGGPALSSVCGMGDVPWRGRPVRIVPLPLDRFADSSLFGDWRVLWRVVDGEIEPVSVGGFAPSSLFGGCLEFSGLLDGAADPFSAGGLTRSSVLGGRFAWRDRRTGAASSRFSSAAGGEGCRNDGSHDGVLSCFDESSAGFCGVGAASRRVARLRGGGAASSCFSGGEKGDRNDGSCGSHEGVLSLLGGSSRDGSRRAAFRSGVSRVPLSRPDTGARAELAPGTPIR